MACLSTKTSRWRWPPFLFMCLSSAAVLTVSAEDEDLSYMGSMDRFWRHHVETETLEHKGVNYFPLIQSCLMEKLSREEWEAIPNARSKSRAVERKVMTPNSSSSSDSSDSDDNEWESTAVLVVVENAIHPVHAKAVQTLASCVREHMPFLYESRAMYIEIGLKEGEDLGGNCPTHIAPLVAIFLPAVRQEMQRTLEAAFDAGGWKEWAEEDATNEFDSSDDEYMPNLNYIGIRASEHLTYTNFPLLAPHTDGPETKVTMNFAFSGPDDYEGGEFYIQTDDDIEERTYLKPNKYDAMVFLGGLYMHGVSEINGGHREMFSTEFWNYPDIPFGSTLWTSLGKNMEKHIRQCNEWEAAAENNTGPCMLEYPDDSAGNYCGLGNVAGECEPRKGEEEEDDGDSGDTEGDDAFDPFKFSTYQKLWFSDQQVFLYACKIAFPIAFCSSSFVWWLITYLEEMAAKQKLTPSHHKHLKSKNDRSGMLIKGVGVAVTCLSVGVVYSFLFGLGGESTGTTDTLALADVDEVVLADLAPGQVLKFHQHGARVGLPPQLVPTLTSYAQQMGLFDIIKDVLYGSPLKPGDEARYFSFQSPYQTKDCDENGCGNEVVRNFTWSVEPPGGSHWKSDIHWFNAADELAHEDSLRVLAKGGFDEVLNGIGNMFGLDSLHVLSVGFLAVTRCEQGYIHHDYEDVDGRAFNFLFGIHSPNDAGPELYIENDDEKRGEVRYGSNAGILVGDRTRHGTKECDHRSNREVRISCSIYLADVNKDNLDTIVSDDTSVFPPTDAAEWMWSQRGRHWNKNGGRSLVEDVGRKPLLLVQDDMDGCEEDKCLVAKDGIAEYRNNCKRTCKIFIDDRKYQPGERRHDILGY